MNALDQIVLAYTFYSVGGVEYLANIIEYVGIKINSFLG